MPKRAASKSPAPSEPSTGKKTRAVKSAEAFSFVGASAKFWAVCYVAFGLLLVTVPHNEAFWMLFYTEKPSKEIELFMSRSFGTIFFYNAAVLWTIKSKERIVEINRLLFGLIFATCVLAIFVHPNILTALFKLSMVSFSVATFACGWGILE